MCKQRAMSRGPLCFFRWAFMIMAVFWVLGCSLTRHSPGEHGAQDQLYQGVIRNDIVLVTSAIAAGAELDYPYEDYNQHTALWIACAKGHADIVKILLSEGANPNLVSYDNTSPLIVAIQDSPNSYDMVQALLDHGANPDPVYKGYFHTTLTDAAIIDNPEIVKLLIDRGASPLTVNSEGNCAMHLASTKCISLLLAGGGNLHVENSEGQKPIHFAAIQGDYEGIIAMIEHGADPNERDRNGQAPLHYIATEPLHICPYGSYVKSAEVLLRHGGDLNMKNATGKRPIDLLFPGSSEENHELRKLLTPPNSPKRP